MGKPTQQELEQALVEAQRMQEAEDDPQYLAHVLLNLHHRFTFLEEVLVAAEAFFKAGEFAEKAHTRLQRAFDVAHDAELHQQTDPAFVEEALGLAGRMREQGHDPQHLAKSLLNLNYRYHYLYRVLDATEHYLHSGRDSLMRDKLEKAMQQARAAEHRSSGEEPETYGLA